MQLAATVVVFLTANFLQLHRVLLKRISAILTAPPKITDKDYQDKKKLVIPKGKGNDVSLC